jgi:phosphatidylinositol alpha-1,6-mannosyltransferase
MLTRWVLRGATHIFANSQHTRKMLLDGWAVPGDKIFVMHPGVDTQRFTPSQRDERARAKLGWADRRVILTVGALQKRKGQDMMIRALPAVRAHCPDVLYAVVGEGWERSYLERLARDTGVSDLVQFRGASDERELVECYQQCDLFALPNRQVGWDFEGFGIALIEAQSCARPVITGLSGGAPETVLPDQSGLVIACDTPDALADAVVSLLNDPKRREAMGRCARKWVAQRFDWSVLVPQAQALFAAI